MATHLVRTQLVYAQPSICKLILPPRQQTSYSFSEPKCGLPTFKSTVLQAGPANEAVLVPREILSHSTLRDDLFQVAQIKK